ncbi:hypothetical protein V2J09_008790 [Rumex salicifolius]
MNEVVIEWCPFLIPNGVWNLRREVWHNCDSYSEWIDECERANNGVEDALIVVPYVHDRCAVDWGYVGVMSCPGSGQLTAPYQRN